MKLNSYDFPKSSFLSVQKDTQTIIQAFMKNNRFQKLLYYTNSSPLGQPDLNQSQKAELMKTNIRFIPKLFIDENVENYVVVIFDNFSPNFNNPEFRDNVIIFDIVCHIDQWQLDEYKLRPFLIAAEIDTMFNNKHLSGIGTLEFRAAEIHPMSDELIAFSVAYQAIHGEDDRKDMINPKEQIEYDKQFDEMFNR